jgi:hypothetical protein
VDQATLLDFISMCDVYVTPYLNEAQMTSGTLGLQLRSGEGRRIDALLARQGAARRRARRSGSLRRCQALSAEIAGLLTNDVRRHSMRKRAYAASRSMTWAQTAERYLASFATAREHVAPAILLPSTELLLAANHACFRKSARTTFSPFATVRACSSTPSIP